MFKVRRDDIVCIIAGKDKGKTGKVLKVFPSTGRLIVEGLNMAKKHMKKTSQDQQGGIISKENPMNISNVALFCQRCNRPTRPKVAMISDGTKSRICRKCDGAF